MTTIQIIRSPSGDELVVLPRAEYEMLVAAASERDEDAADGAMYDARKAELAADSAGEGVLSPTPLCPAGHLPLTGGD